MDQIVPALVLLAANLSSGRHGSLRWETVTAIFGWTALASFIAYFVVLWIPHATEIKSYLIQLSGFSMMTALSRDYEKILRPLFPWNR